jgi:hypothetical protein
MAFSGTISNTKMFVNGIESPSYECEIGDTVKFQLEASAIAGVDRIQIWVREEPYDGSTITSGEYTLVSGDIYNGVYEFEFVVPAQYTDLTDIKIGLDGNYYNIIPYDNNGDSNIGWKETFTVNEITVAISNLDGKVAMLKGTLPLNLNQNPAGALSWNVSQSYNDSIFSWSSGEDTRLEILEAGDYILTANIPQNSSIQRSNILVYVYVNGSKVDVGQGASAYIRNGSNHTESSAYISAFLQGLSVNDYVEIFVEIEGASGTLNAETHTLYVEKVDDKVVFSARGTETIAGTDINQASDFKWETEDRKDSGYTHSTSVDPNEITLDEAGNYLVLLTIPETSSVLRSNAGARIQLDGTTVGEAKQGYIRNSEQENSSIHYAGVVQSSSPNQVLSVLMSIDGETGIVTVPTGTSGNIVIIKLPDNKVYYGKATQVGGSDEWAPSTESDVNWATDEIIDTSIYTHSTSSNNHQITVKEDGDYFFTFNVGLSSVSARANTRIKIYVNDIEQEGFQAKHAYIRNSSGHNDSSLVTSGLLDGLSIDDVITVTAQVESITGIDDTTPAELLLVKKEAVVVVSISESGSGSEIIQKTQSASLVDVEEVGSGAEDIIAETGFILTQSGSLVEVWELYKPREAILKEEGQAKEVSDEGISGSEVFAKATSYIGESGISSDIVSFLASITLDEQGTLSDILEASNVFVLLEQGVGAEEIQEKIETLLVESGIGSEEIVFGIVVPLLDTGEGDEQFSLSNIFEIVDIGEGGEALNGKNVFVLQDSGEGDENISIIFSNLVLGEDINGGENITLSAMAFISEGGVTQENLSKQVSAFLSEIVIGSDSADVRALLEASEEGNLSDLLSIMLQTPIVDEGIGADSILTKALAQVLEEGSGDELIKALVSIGVLDDAVFSDKETIRVYVTEKEEGVSEDSFSISTEASVEDSGDAEETLRKAYVVKDSGEGEDESLLAVFYIKKATLKNGYGGTIRVMAHKKYFSLKGMKRKYSVQLKKKTLNMKDNKKSFIIKK